MRINVAVRSLLLVAFMTLGMRGVSSAQLILTIGIAPPPLPVYVQPPCPAEGYIWTPGYWAYAADGYFWVPGTWVEVPQPGFLWTPGYWGWGGDAFVFHEGYWGPQVGFYGGVNYGFGYAGVGFQGGEWRGGTFFYNRSVSNVTNVTNVYTKTVVVNNVTINNVSYNGGAGGITARPTAQEQAAANERHVPPTSVQTEHVRMASTNRQLFESVNHGKPAIAATAKPGAFSGTGVVAARAAAPNYKPATARKAGPAPAATATNAKPNNAKPANAKPANGGPRPGTPVHPNELPSAAHAAPNTGNPQLDKKYQQQQSKLNASQEKERQQLQQKQEQDHQRLTKTKASEPAKQQVEQKHQQQTQQLAQKHAGQQQKLQSKQPAPATANRKPEKP
jgi:hypothetical protein